MLLVVTNDKYKCLYSWGVFEGSKRIAEFKLSYEFLDMMVDVDEIPILVANGLYEKIFVEHGLAMAQEWAIFANVAMGHEPYVPEPVKNISPDHMITIIDDALVYNELTDDQKMMRQDSIQNQALFNHIHMLPGMMELVEYPAEAKAKEKEDFGPEAELAPSNLADVIIGLNDKFMWSRERIADWLETLDIDITFRSKENEHNDSD